MEIALVRRAPGGTLTPDDWAARDIIFASLGTVVSFRDGVNDGDSFSISGKREE